MDYTHLTTGGILATISGFLVKLGWGTVQKDRAALHEIKEELTLQRTNCLATLQAQGQTQIEILNGINEKMAEQNGFIRGYIEGGGKHERS